MRIFVGSSVKQVVLSKNKRCIDTEATADTSIGQLVSKLRAKGHLVEPWWEGATFKKGRNLLDSLIEKARTCNGGIFVVRGDDRLAAEEGRGNIGVPRGNVILECGMFLATKGKGATFIIKDGPYDAISWPSDILGTLFSDLQDPALSEDVHRFFIDGVAERNASSEVYINDAMMQSILDRQCAHWSTKGLFLGVESARRWTDIESGNDYLHDKMFVSEFVNHVHRNVAIPINFEEIDNIISLGPGCGVFDNFVVNKVAEFRPHICYIPIDINPYLAREAVTHIRSKNPRVITPFTIIDDFEAHSRHVGAVIKQRISDYRQVNVFMMLGGTFSNLEGDEQDIVQKFKMWMDVNDYLVVDAFIKNDDYSYQDDTEVHVRTINGAYRKFLTNACINKLVCAVKGDVSRATQDLVAMVANDLSSVLSDGEVPQDERQRYTQLPGTVVTAYTTNLDGAWAEMRKEMLIAKRYNNEELEKFMRNHFEVLYHFTRFKDGTNKGRAMFLLKKRSA